MNEYKMNAVASCMGEEFDDVIKNMYIDEKMSSIEIANEILNMTEINISNRFIQSRLTKMGITRSPSERFKLAIERGRMDYAPRRKPIKAQELRKGINLKLRYQILKRDNFKCVLCGATAKDEILVIDHITPVLHGGDNNPDNLRVLCRACNHGKMIYENEK